MGVRVLVTGMGGELGSLVTSQLEREPWVGQIVGFDGDPPRRRLRRAEFHRIAPFDDERIQRFVRHVDPEVLVHFAVFEPEARASARDAAHWTPGAAASVFAAAAVTPSLQSVVVRSGIEVYGRGGSRPAVPDESAPVAPTSPFGRQLADVEARARLLGRERGVPISVLRLAPVMGPHVPSPLGRLLRLPVVPVDLPGLVRRQRFSVVDDRDAARAVVLAAARRLDAALNVVTADDVGVLAALRHGRRVPALVTGPQWLLARTWATAFGAPVPAHVVELLGRGRRADGSQARSELGFHPVWSSEQIVDALYDWARVIHVRPHGRSDFLAVEGA